MLSDATRSQIKKKQITVLTDLVKYLKLLQEQPHTSPARPPLFSSSTPSSISFAPGAAKHAAAGGVVKTEGSDGANHASVQGGVGDNEGKRGDGGGGCVVEEGVVVQSFLESRCILSAIVDLPSWKIR